jgi:hypothetical protein
MPSFTSWARAAAGLAVTRFVNFRAALRKSLEKVGLLGSSTTRAADAFFTDLATANFGISFSDQDQS